MIYDPPASSEIDTGPRGPISFLIGSGMVWLVVGGILALIAGIQLHSPGFLEACPYLTHGRARALAETAFLYGWGANAALAVGIWILARLSGAPLRGLGLCKVGAAFWNLAVTAGLVCIAVGEGTGIVFLQIPRYLHPVLLVSYAAVATPGVLAWTGRRQSGTYAAQWYALAALFLFPWIYSAGQLMLLAMPVRGIAHAVTAAWFAQNLVILWLIPTALAAAYYLVPKLTSRTVDHYDFAVHGFWVLVGIGSWTGVRHLLGGPVPAWIPTIGVAMTFMLLFHYVIVAVNLHFGMHSGKDSVGRFLALGLLLYIVGGFADSIFSFQSLAATVQFTYFGLAQAKLTLVGAFSFIIFAAIYYLGPRITGTAWPSRGLVNAHFGISVLGLGLSVLGMAGAGWVQGAALRHAEASFGEIAAGARPWLMAATAGDALLLLGAVVLFFNFARLQAAACCASREVATVRLEAPAL